MRFIFIYLLYVVRIETYSTMRNDEMVTIICKRCTVTEALCLIHDQRNLYYTGRTLSPKWDINLWNYADFGKLMVILGTFFLLCMFYAYDVSGIVISLN